MCWFRFMTWIARPSTAPRELTPTRSGLKCLVPSGSAILNGERKGIALKAVALAKSNLEYYSNKSWCIVANTRHLRRAYSPILPARVPFPVAGQPLEWCRGAVDGVSNTKQGTGTARSCPSNKGVAGSLMYFVHDSKLLLLLLLRIVVLLNTKGIYPEMRVTNIICESHSIFNYSWGLQRIQSVVVLKQAQP